MHINLNLLIESVNKRFRGNDRNLILLQLCDDNEIRVSKGDVAYFCDHSRLMKILELNEVDLKNVSQTYDVLSKHLSNQLSGSIGQKVHPEIRSAEGDPI